MKKLTAAFAALFVLAGLYIASLHSYLLFHSLAEGFAVVIACGIFMVAWNTRRHVSNDYLLLIGIAYLFVGILDFVHTLSYSGMNIFVGYDANAPTQLWIAARYMQSLTLLAAPLLLHRRFRPGIFLLIYGSITTVVLMSIFYWRIFPDCFDPEAGGLTPFKKISEYIICLILLVAGGLVYRRRDQLDAGFTKWLLMSIGATVLSELAFTSYAGVFGFSNLIGHYLKIVSFYFMYKAVIETGLAKPHNLLFGELQRQRESLHASEERYRLLLAVLPAAMYTCDAAGVITYHNEQAVRLWGRSPRPGDTDERFCGSFRLRRPDGTPLPHSQTPMATVLRDATSVRNQEVIIERPGGDRLNVSVNIDPLYDASDRISGAINVFTDITDRKQAEAALRQLNDMLEQKVAERTALAGARSQQLQSLAVQLIEAEERERRRIAQLLHDDLQQILASAKMQLQAARAALPFNPLLPNVEFLLETVIGKSRRLSHELSPPVLHHSGLTAGLKWLCGQMDEQFGLKVELETQTVRQFDVTSLKVFMFRAAHELLFNVVKHAGVKCARIALAGSEAGLEITVSDQGRGFDPGILEKAKESAGFGLLSIRERAGSMGGILTIDSAPGQGSRFNLKVPFKMAETAASISPGPTAGKQILPPVGRLPQPGSLRVLFADDHKLMRQGLIELIAGQPGIEVAGEAANGRQAVELARQLSPDVILMDILMPEMDGVEATRRIKAEFPAIRIIGLSMLDDEQVARTMRAAGAQTFLSKTVSSAELLKEIYGNTADLRDSRYKN
ncbi:MAG: MASE3 domain-containing protein [Desulfobacterales bacterium]